MNCKDYIHPFLHDPGTSQRQRTMDDLLNGEPIDGRTLAGLLDFFRQLSRQVNYYDKNLTTYNWTPFFENSLPFSLASLIQWNEKTITSSLNMFRKKFRYNPSKVRLQQLIQFIYNKQVRPLTAWSNQFNNSGLSIEKVMRALMQKNSLNSIQTFIMLSNTAMEKLLVKGIDFSPLLQQSNPWFLQPQQLLLDKNSLIQPGQTLRQKRKVIADALLDIAYVFQDILHSLIGIADISLLESFDKLKDEFRQKHPPHLALIFAFLRLFEQLQTGLNALTKKHLDYFYQKVLHLMPQQGIADEANLVFEIQNELDAYALAQGTKVKGPKDSKGQDILFELEEDIVINKTQITDARTLCVHNEWVKDKAYVQGVYMAPNAFMADGLTKPFKDGSPSSWSTLGNEWSKYKEPDGDFIKPFPNARIGFVLASPVLYLQEGQRTITITLDCLLKNNLCKDIVELAPDQSDPCCDGIQGINTSSQEPNLPDLYDPDPLFAQLKKTLERTNPNSKDGLFYYVNQDLIAQAKKLGINKKTASDLEDFLIDAITKMDDPAHVCYCDKEIKKYETIVPAVDFESFFDAITLDLLKPVFPIQTGLKISYSGAKKWIIAKSSDLIEFSPALTASGSDYTFSIKITTSLEASEDAVDLFNSEVLKEPLDTVLPVVKVELNDKIKLEIEIPEMQDLTCCLKDQPKKTQEVSLYHFFRNVLLEKTTIDVAVCGVKNLIVQNDESLQDVNKPVYPFGTRPEIIDFDIVYPAANQPANPNLVGPNFYIGSREIFLKKWNSITINLNWKDKPIDFANYYMGYIKTGLDEKNFEVNLSLLDQGMWNKEKGDAKTTQNGTTKDFNRTLFIIDPGNSDCNKNTTTTTVTNQPFLYSFIIDDPNYFTWNKIFGDITKPLDSYNVHSQRGFLRIQMQNQDFLHKDYSYVLARQMMAFGKLPNDHVEAAVYYNSVGSPIVFNSSAIAKNISDSALIINDVDPKIQSINTDAFTVPNNVAGKHIAIPEADDIRNKLTAVFNLPNPPSPPNPPILLKLTDEITTLKTFLNVDDSIINGTKQYQAVIPNEPWTPIIKNMAIDYTATATADNTSKITESEITLYHLYPFENTYKKEDITKDPSLFPSFCDEGTLYLGLENLVPGSNVSFLFQLAEASSDTEENFIPVQWHYLENNEWRILRNQFEVLEDQTENLSTSGIVKIAMPPGMTPDNTILPAGLFWIKATISQNIEIVSETIAIRTQAVKAQFIKSIDNDLNRLSQSLPSQSLSRLDVADTAIKKVEQPFDSFGGRPPETQGYYYVRVSELLRHKGRAIQKFDYERIALDLYPQIFKAKCINHSFFLNAHRYINDYPMAPGYVLLAVIPDLNQLKAGLSYEPRVPLSMLEEIQSDLQKRASPFVRINVVNPRYESVDFCLRIKLKTGKDESFYKRKIQNDIRQFMAPWVVGQYDKLNFGQRVNRSDVIHFLEGLDYLDYIIEFKWRHEDDDTELTAGEQPEIAPITPRSILVAGSIDVCIIPLDCPQWARIGSCQNKPQLIIDYCSESKALY